MQTTRDLSQRAATPSLSGSDARIHFRSSSHLRTTSPIIIRVHGKVFPYLANANDAIRPLNRAPTCTKFRKAINRGTDDQSPNVDVENHARVPTHSLNQITRKSKSADRNSVSRVGSATVYVAWLQQISLSLHYAQSKVHREKYPDEMLNVEYHCVTRKRVCARRKQAHNNVTYKTGRASLNET